ncbi:MAG: NAD(P)H-binding protein [Methanobrevibacter sp.]|nr:NAD(P)H-binding protein [Methanobrevibacter sp.]
MNIAILGATGKFGISLTAKLLAVTDHHLTLISTSAGRLYEDNHRITAKSVNATDARALRKALKDQDLVYFAISGDYIPVMVDNIININPKRFIFMASVGIYNELEGEGAEFNVDNDQSQIPNQYAAELIEASDVDYTIIRAGYLEHGEEDDYVITKKGETPAGYRTSMESVQKIALEIIEEPEKYSRESISVTKDMGKN